MECGAGTTGRDPEPPSATLMPITASGAITKSWVCRVAELTQARDSTAVGT